MLVVQPLDSQGQAEGAPLLAIDDLGSSHGDRVILTGDGHWVRELIGADNTPVRWAVIGLADET
jgi:ethanolamine utilization protein EutN